MICRKVVERVAASSFACLQKRIGDPGMGIWVINQQGKKAASCPAAFLPFELES
jgi:hypothetical protein